jgi:hypothetical protein
MAECVHHFLVGGVFENFCNLICPRFTRQFGKVTVFDMRHRFAGKSSFKVFDGDGFNAGVVVRHGFHSCRLICSSNRYGVNNRYYLLIGKIDYINKFNSLFIFISHPDVNIR